MTMQQVLHPMERMLFDKQCTLRHHAIVRHWACMSTIWHTHTLQMSNGVVHITVPLAPSGQSNGPKWRSKAECSLPA
jgi:hypothetical protein